METELTLETYMKALKANKKISKLIISCLLSCYIFLTEIFFFIFTGKPFFQSIEDHINADETGGFVDGGNLQLGSPARSSPHSQGSDNGERFSRKVFVGGLPPDIDEGKFFQFKYLQPTVISKIFPFLSSSLRICELLKKRSNNFYSYCC